MSRSSSSSTLAHTYQNGVTPTPAHKSHEGVAAKNEGTLGTLSLNRDGLTLRISRFIILIEKCGKGSHGLKIEIRLVLNSSGLQITLAGFHNSKI